MSVLLILSLCAVPVFAADYDSENATGFVFSDSGITVTEGAYTGYKVKGTALSITGAGTYVISGSCSDGTIIVKKNVTGVILGLDGLTLSASATAPITCNKGSEVTIIAKSGTLSTLTDDKYNNDDIYTDTELYPDIENAVIKCKDGSNVTINGTGTININSYGKNGIKSGYDLYEEDGNGNATATLLSTASLTIREVTLNVNAVANDGIKSDKELNIISGNISVSAADDAIKCDYVMNIGEEGTEGPTIKIAKSTEGIEAAQINIYSGNITVNATDDGINAANNDLSSYSFGYNQYGGYVYVNCSKGDGIDSNGTILLKGGTLEVYAPSSGDGEPLDSESTVTFAGATVLAVGQNQMNQPLASSGASYVTFGKSSGARPGGIFGGGNTAVVTASNTINVKDSSGNTIYSGKAVRNASYVVFSSPSLAGGSSYTLYNGNSSAATATAVSSSSGNQPGGQQAGDNQPGQSPGQKTEENQPGWEPGQQQGNQQEAENNTGTGDKSSIVNTIIEFLISVWNWIVSVISKIKALF